MTYASLVALPSFRKAAHPNCIVCDSENNAGLNLDFVLSDNGGVHAHFYCDPIYEGYPGMLHGGVISSLLDGAMTNCLFAHERIGLTGELTVRFRYPVATVKGALVRAWIEKFSSPFYQLKAELIQDQQVKAKATGKFVERTHFNSLNNPVS